MYVPFLLKFYNLCIFVPSGKNVFGRYLENDIDVQRRDPEQVPVYNSMDHDNSAYLAQGIKFNILIETTHQT